MNRTKNVLLTLALFIGTLPFLGKMINATEMKYYEVIFPAPAAPEAGELVMAAEWRIAIPKGVQTLRGVLIHQHGCGEGSGNSGRTGAIDLHWQALAAKYDCALLAVSYRQENHPCENWCDPRNGSAQSLFKALDHFAQTSGHPELSVIPWTLWGHSGGAHWSGSMVQLYPQRVVAAWLRSGHPDCVGLTFDSLPMNEDVLTVPIMLNLGAKETDISFVWDTAWVYFQKIRAQGAKIGVMIDPETHHETGNSRYPAIRFLDICMEQRLPVVPGSSELRPMQTEVLLPANELEDESHRAFVQNGIWLPCEEFVDVWKKYSADNTFEDETPPPAPTDVSIDSVGLMTWKCDADLESGLETFAIYCNGEEIAKLPTAPTVNGRPLFQGMSYSDTPDASLPIMAFKIDPYRAEEEKVYSVAAINTAGLVSSQTEAQKR
ncbi:MAG: hypothetical protein Q4C95_03730 [Planctomycetia bacterium]|nr:hypothetical protein [Planctomycetia bacterium]